MIFSIVRLASKPHLVLRMADETKLKSSSGSSKYGSVVDEPIVRSTVGDSDEDSVNPERRQIGLTSAIFIIFNRIIGTGVFATPSSILSLSGSVGLSLCVFYLLCKIICLFRHRFMWVIGAIIASAGMWTYIVWGTVCLAI